MSITEHTSYYEMRQYIKRNNIYNHSYSTIPFSSINGKYHKSVKYHKYHKTKHYLGGTLSEEAPVINYTCISDDASYDQMSEYVASRLTTNKSAKQDRGEVFTPISSITGSKSAKNYYDMESENFLGGMLDYLPDEIWSNPDLKWLDPANGIGNFSICVYYRLMDGLKKIIPDITTRSRHIIQNMLYMVELDPDNVNASLGIFCYRSDGDIIQGNIYQGSFLTPDLIRTINRDPTIHKRWPEKFDVIMGNPPYNSGGCRVCSSSQKGKARNMTLWPEFVKQALTMLRTDGFLTFITPLSWMRISHELHSTLLRLHMIWLEIWDDLQSRKMFRGGAKIPCSLYVLQNTQNITRQSTIIRSRIARQYLDRTYYHQYLDPTKNTPLAYFSIFNILEQFLQDNPDFKLKVLRKTVEGIGAPMVLPAHYLASNNLGVTTLLIKGDVGIMVQEMKSRHPDTDKAKLILANKTSTRGSFIDDGRLGLIGHHKFYILDQEPKREYLRDQFIDLLESKKKPELQMMCQELGIKIKGTRSEIIKRITEFYRDKLGKSIALSSELSDDIAEGSGSGSSLYDQDTSLDGLQQLKRLFDTNLVNMLAAATKYGQSYLDAVLFNYLPDVRLFPKDILPVVDDEHLAEYFNFSVTDINYIIQEKTSRSEDDKIICQTQPSSHEISCKLLADVTPEIKRPLTKKTDRLYGNLDPCHKVHHITCKKGTSYPECIWDRTQEPGKKCRTKDK